MIANRVYVASRAARDVRSILIWLKGRSVQGAQRWVAAFESAKLRLSENPKAYSVIPERIRVPYELRDILFKTPKGKKYRAIFTIIGDEVRILRVRRPAQRPIRGRDLPKP
jgi:plasmid stabilization system protein ParE